MNEPRESFRERLLARERFTPTYQEKYEKEVKAMLEQKLTGAKRWAYIGFMALGIFFTVVFGTAAVLAPREFSTLARAVFVTGAIFGLAWAVLLGWVLKKGTLDKIVHPKAMMGLTWGFLVITLTLFLLMGRYLDPIIHVQMLVSGLVFLGFATVMMISSRIDQAELKTREKLLEIEYRLAEIAEAVAKKE